MHQLFYKKELIGTMFIDKWDTNKTFKQLYYDALSYFEGTEVEEFISFIGERFNVYDGVEVTVVAQDKYGIVI